MIYLYFYLYEIYFIFIATDQQSGLNRFWTVFSTAVKIC